MSVVLTTRRKTQSKDTRTTNLRSFQKTRPLDPRFRRASLQARKSWMKQPLAQKQRTRRRDGGGSAVAVNLSAGARVRHGRECHRDDRALDARQERSRCISSVRWAELGLDVASILARREGSTGTEYRVLWKGYPLDEATWEPKSNLDCDGLIEQFEASNGDAVAAETQPPSPKRHKPTPARSRPRRNSVQPSRFAEVSHLIPTSFNYRELAKQQEHEEAAAEAEAADPAQAHGQELHGAAAVAATRPSYRGEPRVQMLSSGGSWYSGDVASVNEVDGTIDILFDDGSADEAVPLSVRGDPSPDLRFFASWLESVGSGTRVEVQQHGHWHEATVRRAQERQVFVCYRDGRGGWVPREEARLRRRIAAARLRPSVADELDQQPEAKRVKASSNPDEWEWVPVTKAGSGLDGGYWGSETQHRWGAARAQPAQDDDEEEPSPRPRRESIPPSRYAQVSHKIPTSFNHKELATQLAKEEHEKANQRRRKEEREAKNAA